MTSGSLNKRLLLAAGAWIVVALVVAAIVLTGLFRQHAEGVLAQRIEGHLEELIGAWLVPRTATSY